MDRKETGQHMWKPYPLAQPENVFTLPAYQELLTLRRSLQSQRWDRERSDEEKREIQRRMDALEAEYYARLPVYLLARCPFCGGRAWERIDTLSLNGIGWHQAYGFGWQTRSVSGWNEARRAYDEFSFQRECEHAQFLTYAVNFNGQQPTDVYRNVHLGPEKPFVPDNFGRFSLVLHTLPLGRYDGAQPGYTIYLVTCFTQASDALASSCFGFGRQENDGGYAFRYHEVTYDLRRWQERGALFWLDTTQPDLPLASGPEEAFPYAGVQGLEGELLLEEGTIAPWRPKGPTYERRPRPPRDPQQPNDGIIASLLRFIFGDK